LPPEAQVSDEFVGSGWSFPLRTDPTGRMALVSHDREVEESIRLILGTAFGERPMRPDYGCAIHDYVFGGADPDLAARLAEAVRAALVRWEPRIDLLDVQVGFDEDEAALVYIDVRYSVGDTNDPRNLVFPFYTIPPEE
jgi:phage baseplate assembly protein W